MKPPKDKSLPSLTEVEQQVVAESREWGRRRLQKRLQQFADQIGEVFPLSQRKRRPLTLRTEVGSITLTVDYGQEAQSGRCIARFNSNGDCARTKN